MMSPATLLRCRVAPVEHSCPLAARWRNWWNKEDGDALIELAFALPILFALIFAFIEISLMFYTYETISEAAREGTRYAMVRGASCPTAANPTCEVNAAAVNAYVSGLTLPNVGGGTLTPNTTYPDGDENIGHHVQVQVTYNYHVLLPFVPNNAFTMSSSSKVTILQ